MQNEQISATEKRIFGWVREFALLNYLKLLKKKKNSSSQWFSKLS